MNGRLVGTRTPDLYRVKAASLCTSNNLEGVGERLSTWKRGQDGILTGEITGEEILTIPELTSQARPMDFRVVS